MRVGRVATEDDGLVPSAELRANPAGIRQATALLTLSLRASASARRAALAANVHGDGDHGFIATFVGLARQHAWRLRGGRQQRWPAVHRSDAAPPGPPGC